MCVLQVDRSLVVYDYVQVDQVRLVGIMLLVFVHNDIYDAVTEVDVQSVGTGMLGRLVRTDHVTS